MVRVLLRFCIRRCRKHRDEDNGLVAEDEGLYGTFSEFEELVIRFNEIKHDKS